MQHATCLKVKNSEFWSICDPKNFIKGIVDCTANSILQIRYILHFKIRKLMFEGKNLYPKIPCLESGNFR